MSLAVPAVMPLSWEFSAHWFASFGTVDRRQPEQERNRRPRLDAQAEDLLLAVGRHSPRGTNTIAENQAGLDVGGSSGTAPSAVVRYAHRERIRLHERR